MAPILATRGGGSIKGYGFSRILSAATQAFDSIATYALATSPNSVTFSNLDSTASAYTHLQLRTNARVTFTGGNGISGLYFTFNGDTNAANYSYRRIGTDGLGDPAQYAVGSLLDGIMFATGQGNGGMPILDNVPCGTLLDIYNFNSSTNNKVVHAWGAAATKDTSAGVHYMQIMAKGWFSTAPITSITITAAQGNIQSGTHLALYGIKG